MPIVMRGNKIGIEKVGKAAKKQGGIIMPEVADSLGIIRYLGDEAEKDLEIGDKVYYGTERQQVRMGGADIEVMESDNVLAIVEEPLSEKTETETTQTP